MSLKRCACCPEGSCELPAGHPLCFVFAQLAAACDHRGTILISFRLDHSTVAGLSDAQ